MCVSVFTEVREEIRKAESYVEHETTRRTILSATLYPVFT